MVSYANKRRLGEKPPTGIRNRKRSAAWYEEQAADSLVEGKKGARLIGRAFGEGERAELDYEFPDVDTMRKEFAGLWARIEPRLRKAGAATYAFLDYEDERNRRWIEPILVGQLFSSAADYAVLERRGSFSGGSEPGLPPGTSLRSYQSGDERTLLPGRIELARGRTVPTEDSLASDFKEALFASVADVDGTAEGFIALSEADGFVWIGLLAVAESQRGKGLGAALLAAALGWARDNRPGTAIRLYTDFDRGPALALYKKHGFQQAFTGVQFRRPLDQDVIEEILSKRRNTYSRWVGFR